MIVTHNKDGSTEWKDAQGHLKMSIDSSGDMRFYPSKSPSAWSNTTPVIKQRNMPLLVILQHPVVAFILGWILAYLKWGLK